MRVEQPTYNGVGLNNVNNIGIDKKYNGIGLIIATTVIPLKLIDKVQEYKKWIDLNTMLNEIK